MLIVAGNLNSGLSYLITIVCSTDFLRHFSIYIHWSPSIIELAETKRRHNGNPGTGWDFGDFSGKKDQVIGLM